MLELKKLIIEIYPLLINSMTLGYSIDYSVLKNACIILESELSDSSYDALIT